MMWKKNQLTEMGITLTATYGRAAWEETGEGVPGVTIRQAQKMRGAENEKDDPVNFTAWCEETEMRVTDRDGLRSAAVTVLRLCGSSEHLIPYGKILQETDKEGCLLGEKTAEDLFGSHEVEGLTVLYGGREFTVRGVLKEPADIFIVQETNEGAVLDRITLARTNISKEKLREFCDGYGLSGMVAVNEAQTVWETLLDLVPGKWSDFDGWEANVKSLAKEETAKKKTSKSMMEIRDAEHRNVAVSLLICSGALLLFGMLAAGGEKERSNR